MKRTGLNITYSSMLIMALLFGQVGSGFLHNKHDAHEAVIDLDIDGPVLLNHGEHCKVCAVDWVHQFLAEDFSIDFGQPHFDFPPSQDASSLYKLSVDLKSSRAPPFLI